MEPRAKGIHFLPLRCARPAMQNEMPEEKVRESFLPGRIQRSCGPVHGAQVALIFSDAGLADLAGGSESVRNRAIEASVRSRSERAIMWVNF